MKRNCNDDCEQGKECDCGSQLTLVDGILILTIIVTLANLALTLFNIMGW